ncbi:hypothetical protein [Microtetraspora malaysiensis]|uniref:hypothetical protein n=1 Tax=Microtetraspora malaysiensis TaxID=161358 RepID=UPI0012FCE0A3|nr:hypothetical protein [Microtetraspora malaysiensis]
MLLGWDALRSSDWSQLSHAYGPATDTPGHLERLFEDDHAGWAKTIDHLYWSVTHQSSVTTATPPAALVVAGLLGDQRLDQPITADGLEPKPVSAHLLDFLAIVAEGTEPDRTEGEVWDAYCGPPIDELDMVWRSKPFTEGYEAVIKCREVCPALVDPVLQRLTADDLHTRLAATSTAALLGLVPSVTNRRAEIIKLLEAIAHSADIHHERAHALVERLARSTR